MLSQSRMGAVRLVSRGGIGAVPIPGGGDRDGDRQAVEPVEVGAFLRGAESTIIRV
jgi:hypothetical protein